MAAPNHSPAYQTNGNWVLKSQTQAWLSPGMGEAAGTHLPWPRGLHESQLHAPKASTLLVQSLGLCTATSPTPKRPHPRAARQTPEHPGSHLGPILSLGTPGCWQGPAAHTVASTVAGGCTGSRVGCAPCQPQNHPTTALSWGLG